MGVFQTNQAKFGVCAFFPYPSPLYHNSISSCLRVLQNFRAYSGGPATDVARRLSSAGFMVLFSQKGTSALRALADELKTEQGSTSYADTMASELAELFQAEEEKAAKEIEEREGPVKAKLEKATANLEEAMAEAKEARAAFEGDFLLQLMSFRQKGVLRQAAFVAAVLIANQAVYQAILVADDRDGNPAIALGGLAASAALVWVYGYRPFSL